jgi:hypothetical protein
MRNPSERSFRRYAAPLLALLLVADLRPLAAAAAIGCPSPQPDYAYIDADNDGCYTDGVDSTSIDSALQAPTFVGPAGTGVVIPSSLVLPNQANPYWSVPNDVWIDGQVSGPSELIVEAGGTTYIQGRIRMSARGEGYEGDTTLGCLTGCGPVVIGDGAKLTANGYLTIYDATIGDDVRIVAPCAPGDNFSCYAWLDLLRPVAIGDRFQVRSPGGIMFHEGALPLAIGDDLKLQTKSITMDGGTIGFDIDIYPIAGFTIGANAKIRAGGTLTLGAGASGPVEIGAGARISGVGIGTSLKGTSIMVGAGSQIRAGYDASYAKYMPVDLSAEGPIDIADGVRVSGGEIGIDAGVGTLTLGAGTSVASTGRVQAIVLVGESISVGADSTLQKSTLDSDPLRFNASSAVTVFSSSLRGAGLDVTVTAPAATITFTNDEVRGSPGSVATFRTLAGGSCDLSGSSFAALDLDVSQCGSVIGP